MHLAAPWRSTRCISVGLAIHRLVPSEFRRRLNLGDSISVYFREQRDRPLRSPSTETKSRVATRLQRAGIAGGDALVEGQRAFAFRKSSVCPNA